MTKKTETLVDPEQDAGATITAKQLAGELGTDPKSFRRFLRSLTEDRAGKGGRWLFDDATAEAIRKAWEAKATKGTTPDITDEA